MKHYEETFGLKVQRSNAYEVTLLESSVAGNILYPGEQPKFQFLLQNNLDKPITVQGKVDVIAYGTRGIPGDVWLPDVYKIEDLPSVPLAVDLPAKGSQVVTIEPTLPERFGGYALIVDLGEAGRRFGTTCVRTFEASTERLQFPKTSLDESAGVDVLRRLGIQAVRMGWPYTPTTDPHYDKKMGELKAKLKELHDNNITVLLMILNGVDTKEQPLGRGRPHLTDSGVMRKTKEDLAWPPKFDPDFEKVVTAICAEEGWPKGPVTAVQLWNEPWEGISISGWGADMPRYREMYTAMAKGVEAARRQGAQVLITGCDSSENTLDKLFADGKDDYLKWLDACTIHYQGLTSPAIFRSWLNRSGPLGRVKIWDTESWVANTDDRVAVVIGADRAAGYDRAMGVFYGNISQVTKKSVTMPDKTRRQVETHEAWSPAAAVGAAQHFIGERDFKKLLFLNGLPWVMAFESAGHTEDATFLVVGDLQDTMGEGRLPFRQVTGLENLAVTAKRRQQLAALPSDAPERAALEEELNAPQALAGVQMTVANPDGEFQLFDFYGNPVPANGGSLVIPLDNRGFFLRTNGSPGSVGRLEKALAEARITGYVPVEIIAHDLLTPVDAGSSLRLTLTNVLNRPIQGKLAASLGDLKLELPPSVALGPHETKDVLIPIHAGKADPANRYALDVRFDAGPDGGAAHAEVLHVNRIAKRTIAVDGKLDDWKGVLPQGVRATGSDGPTLMEAAWLPFETFSQGQKTGAATGYAAYDDEYFYFGAKVAADGPWRGTLRYAKRDDDAYYYPEVSYEYDPDKTLLKEDMVWHQPSRNAAALLLPGSETERSFTCWNSVVRDFAVDLDLPEGSFRKVSFYFVDPDHYRFGRRQVAVEVQDRDTGRVLAKDNVSEYGVGEYMSLLLSGRVRVVFRSKVWWLSATLSGVFFDPAGEGTPAAPPTGSAARLLGHDDKTAAHWQGVYGKDGYEVVGTAASLPNYAKLTPVEQAEKIEHVWPKDLRRYSYRRKPDLPNGSGPNRFDNVQLAFNVIPKDEKTNMIAAAPGTMQGFVSYEDTDYEYAFNPVDKEYGGGMEMWRLLVPGMPRKNFYPRQPASPYDGPVTGGKLAFTNEGGTRMMEAAIPWSEIPLVKEAMEEGRTVKLTFRVNDQTEPPMELAEGRSVSQPNPHTFHPGWTKHWANELEFSFEK